VRALSNLGERKGTGVLLAFSFSLSLTYISPFLDFRSIFLKR
jgi:hypothetical protein